VTLSAADEAAFRVFAGSRRRSLRHSAFLLCGDWHQADDLVQSTLTKLYIAWRRVRAGTEPDAYTRRIMLNVYLDERRRPWRREFPTERLAERRARADDSETRLDLIDALMRLPARQRATLVLRFWVDASVAETADTLGCSEGTVKSQTARALVTLKQLLGDREMMWEEIR